MRTVECDDGRRWKITAVSRPSVFRIELVFESLDQPETRLRREAEAGGLAELSDAELCFMIGGENSPGG